VGSSHNRLTSAEDNEEALLSGYPPVGLLDAKRIKQTEEKRKQPYIPSLNAEALRLGRVTLLFRAQRRDRCAHQLVDTGLTLRILDRQGACGAITGQGLLLSAKFGIQVTARQLK